MFDMTFMHTNYFDGLETVYHHKFRDVIDYSEFTGIHTMCDFDTLKDMMYLSDFEEGKLYFLGNGNFHYLTLMLTSQINEPYTLVVFDNHNDAGVLPFEGVTSCGSWIDDALKNDPYLQEVIIVGATSDNEKEISFSTSSRLKVTETFEPTSKNIYISVDRDVLAKDQVETNWNQGKMTIERLCVMISNLVESCHVIAGDICGDVVWDYEMVTSDFKHGNAKKSLQSLEKISEAFHT